MRASCSCVQVSQGSNWWQREALQEALMVLRPDGRLCADVPLGQASLCCESTGNRPSSPTAAFAARHPSDPERTRSACPGVHVV
jgi:hypothetical protein